MFKLADNLLGCQSVELILNWHLTCHLRVGCFCITKEDVKGTLKMYQKDLEEPVYQKRTLREAIKLHCLQCCCGNWEEVKKCTCTNTCYLHPFRTGKNPFSTRVYTEEQKKAAAERLAKARKVKEGG